MKSLRSTESLRRWRVKLDGKVVLVPTMGALHQGHQALICKARHLAGSQGSVVVSIFLNPIQFGPREDIASYPKPLKNDIAVCRGPVRMRFFIPPLRTCMCPIVLFLLMRGALRRSLWSCQAGSFPWSLHRGRQTFNIVQPTHAIFGEKDWQQLAIIRRMVRDLNFPVEIVTSPTVRDSDGLAASSRNAYLNSRERALAPLIHVAMHSAAVKFKDPRAIVKAVVRALNKIPGARLDYAEAVDAVTLQPLKNRKSAGRLAVAVFLGKARLIDNIPLPPLS